MQKDKGGYSGGVPPLPIPNREVKPARADGTAGTLGEYGVVRNHFYKITLNGIKGFGTPVYNPDKVIDPTVPSYDNTFLAARVQVLQWRIVNQNVSLGK